jgi:outer membrane biosynthesis protein TonB
MKVRERQKRFPFFLLLSFLLHATLIFLLTLLFTQRRMPQSEKLPEPPPPEVTLEISPPTTPDRPFMEAKEVTDQAPEKAPFQSDQNSKAASELPATGSLPLPSQQGISQTVLELQNQHYTQGEHPASSAGNPVPAHPPTPVAPETPPEKSVPAPIATPLPAATPESSVTPQPTPTTTPPPNSIQIVEPAKNRPTPQTKTPQSPSKQAQSVPAQPASQPGSLGSQKGYQPETRQTVIRGSISNRGRSSVAAEATPIGRYKKAVADAIGSRWYYYVNERMGLLSIGTVSITFTVTASGKVTQLHVVSSNANESLTDCSLRSIMDAKLPPIPPEVVHTLQNDSLETDFNFTIY